MMELHLLIKFQYFAWNRSDKTILTIAEHEKVLSKYGKVYWGRVSSIAQSKVEDLNSQVSDGKKTYASCMQLMSLRPFILMEISGI
jgi:hypothetical protein